MMTAAAVAAGAGFEITLGGDAAQFERFGDVLGDGLLQLVHVFLGIEEPARDRVLQKRIAQLFEVADFGILQGNARLLLLLERLAASHQGIVLTADIVVGHEGVDILAHGANVGLVKDSLAKFLGFLDDNALFSLGLHNLFRFAAGRWRYALNEPTE
jgi:hypothetical protein